MKVVADLDVCTEYIVLHPYNSVGQTHPIIKSAQIGKWKLIRDTDYTHTAVN